MIRSARRLSHSQSEMNHPRIVRLIGYAQGARSAGGKSLRLKILLVPVVLALGGCGAQAAEVPTAQAVSVADLASLLEGEFTTAPSASDPNAAPAQGTVYYIESKRVQVPALGTGAVYGELREGTRDGHIVWQRLFALKLDSDSGRITMTPYSFANSGQMANAAMDPKPLAKLQPADLKPLQGGCVVTWHRTEGAFDGMAAPGPCPAAQPDSSTNPTPVLTVSKTGLVDRLENLGGSEELDFRRLR